MALTDKDYARGQGGGGVVPLLAHAVGKPAGALCLELSEPAAEVALLAALPKLWAMRDANNAWQLVRYLLPMLAELRRRLTEARDALRKLHAALPPPPADAAPLSAVAVGRMLLAMAAEGSEHPGAAAARHAAPKVSEAVGQWQRAGIADALSMIASDLALQAHTLTGHLRRALPLAQGAELLQGVALMSPPAAVLVLASAPRLERFRKLAATGGIDGVSPFPGTNQVQAGVGIGLISGAACNPPAAQATAGSTSAPRPRWAQLLAQQLLTTLWRLHSCGVIPMPAAPTIGPPACGLSAAQLSSSGLSAAFDPQLSAEGRLAGVPRDESPELHSASASRRAATGSRVPRPAQPYSGADGTLPPRALSTRAAGASMPTFTMAATQSQQSRRMPQGALQRLGAGGKLPTAGKLPFRTLIGRPPSRESSLANSCAYGESGHAGSAFAPAPASGGRQSAIRSTLGLTHSLSAPGYF